MDTRTRINPFPGLRPFMQEEADLFFGRDKQSDELVWRLASRRFLAVVGTSGSGKSSLVRAGRCRRWRAASWPRPERAGGW
jgi:hypothetical protein